MRIAHLLLGLTVLICLQARGQSSAYETLEASYKPYLSHTDPFGWPMKVKSLCADPYKFWRGSKDLFFTWCKTNASDWFADRDKFVLCHGDVHLGNVGSYASRERFGSLGFGLVDFDDSARLPYQVDLLQAYISMKLAAQTQNIALDDPSDKALAKILVEKYVTAMNTSGTPSELLADNKFVRKVMKTDADYASEMDFYTDGGKFKPRIMKKTELAEILRPCDERADEFARGLAVAVENDSAARSLFRYSSEAEFREAIRGIVFRTRLGSSGSQGLGKYFVLLRTPFKEIDGDIIVYFKQQIPTAAERTGIVPRDSRPPGQRIAEHLQRFNDPPLLLNTWCDIGSESFWVTVKEPWSDELDPKVAKNFDDLLKISEVFGTTLGSARRLDSQLAGAKLTVNATELAGQVVERGNAFTAKVNSDFAQFTQDPAVQQLVGKAESSLKSGQQ